MTERALNVVLLLAVVLPGGAKPRVIATTDGEIDDRCSMIRFLLYANEWDIRGLIHSSSKYHWLGDANHPRHSWEGTAWLDQQLDAYAAVHDHLRQHGDYPAPEYLRSQVFVGNVNHEGEMTLETPGSNRIVEVLLEDDPSPVWLQAWGGANTIARALKTIAEQHPERVAEVTRKAKLYLIAEQDQTLRNYILPNWPGLEVLLDNAFLAIAYGWQELMTPAQQRSFDGPWMKANILHDHGPLCAMYEAHHDDRRFRSEGDSPSFMHTIPVGLDNVRDPSWGGWGGRFVQDGPLWRSAPEGTEGILRWAAAFQNDWAARADWCVKPRAEANHRPVVLVNGQAGQSALLLRAAPEQVLELSAAGSSDPDGGSLRYRWSTYVEAGSYWEAVPLTAPDAVVTEVRIPANAAGRTVHLILEVTDDGVPPLTSYRRVVLQVSGEPQPTPRDRYLETPITSLSGPPAESGPWAFYRGINLHGPATTIDGQAWEAGDAAQFEAPSVGLNAPQVTLRPPTDPARAAMIHSFRWADGARAKLTAVPAGRYAVYLYVWEDNNSETLAIRLNGQLVAPAHASGVTGEWHRLGPWTVDVTDGAIEIATSGGAANLSGVEVWRRE